MKVDIDASRTDIEVDGTFYTPMVDGTYRIFYGDTMGPMIFSQDDLFDMMPSVTRETEPTTFYDNDIDDFLYRKNDYSSYKDW